jgi:hypothetical protein
METSIERQQIHNLHSGKIRKYIRKKRGTIAMSIGIG